jgi:hypothetical protein
MLKTTANFIKKRGLALAIAILVFLIVSSFLSLSPRGSLRQEKIGIDNQKEIPVQQVGFYSKVLPAQVPKLSETKEPSIDGGGAFNERAVNCQECSCQKTSACSTLPAGAWVLFLVAYLFLLIFNLSITFGKRTTVQWAWEAGFSLLALAIWFWLDTCQANVWYPLFVILLGVLIYIFYLYFFNEHLSRNVEKDKMA